MAARTINTILAPLLLALITTACGTPALTPTPPPKPDTTTILSPTTSLTTTQYFDRGLEYTRAGEHQKAIANYIKAINLAPQNAMA